MFYLAAAKLRATVRIAFDLYARLSHFFHDQILLVQQSAQR
jgi:hypothetical protein